MYIGTVRPRETKTVTVTGAGIPELQKLIAEHLVDGWAIASMPYSKTKGLLTTTATLVRRDGVETVTVTGDDFTAVRAAVPTGDQLLHVRQE